MSVYSYSKFSNTLTIVWCYYVIDILDQAKSLNSFRIQQGSVTEIVCLHDGWIQRREIECCDGDAIVSFDRFNDCSTFILLFRN